MSAVRRAVLGAALVFCLAGADAPAEAPAPPPATMPSPAAPPEAAAPPAASAPAAPSPDATPAPPGAEANPAPPAAEAKPAAPAAPELPKNLETLKASDFVAVLGKNVRDAQGKTMGPVVDVLVDRNGKPLGAVIDFGGFLGVGSRKIAVDWRLLSFNPDDHGAPMELSLDRAEVQAAPEFTPSDRPIEMVGPPPPPPEGPGPAASDGRE
jgi:hypothetical protein